MTTGSRYSFGKEDKETTRVEYKKTGYGKTKPVFSAERFLLPPRRKSPYLTLVVMESDLPMLSVHVSVSSSPLAPLYLKDR